MAEINHRQARRFILAGERQSQTQRDDLSRHLASCPACRAYAAQFEQQMQQVEQSLRQTFHVQFNSIPIPQPAATRAISARMRGQTMKKNLFGFAGVLMALALVIVFFNTSLRSIPVHVDQAATIRFLYLEGSADYQPLADDFHRLHPEITVELVPEPQTEEYVTRFMADIDKVDVLRISLRILDDDTVHKLLPLDSMLAADLQFPRADLFPGSLQVLQADGKQMGIPAGLERWAIFYNPQKLQDAGIQPPSAEWTLDDFLKVAKLVNNQQDAAHFTYGFCSSANTGADVEFFTYLFGGGLFDNNAQPTRPTLNRPENIAALTWYANLKNQYALLPDVSNYYQMITAMAAKSCGFWTDATSRQSFGGETVFGLVKDSLPARMLPLPASAGVVPNAHVEDYSIMASSKYPAAAWEWISYLVNQPTAAGKLIPPLKTQVFARGNPYSLSDDLLAVANRLPDNLVMTPYSMLRSDHTNTVVVQTEEIFFKAAVQVFKGQADAKTALDLAQILAEQVFQK